MQSKENPYFNPSSICTPWKRLDWIGPWTQTVCSLIKSNDHGVALEKNQNEAAVGDLAWRKLNVSTEYLRYLVTALLLQAKWVHTIHFSKMKRSSVVHKKGQNSISWFLRSLHIYRKQNVSVHPTSEAWGWQRDALWPLCFYRTRTACCDRWDKNVRPSLCSLKRKALLDHVAGQWSETHTGKSYR